MKIPTVGIAVMTLNAEYHLPHCLLPLISSPLRPRILVVDSSSSDNTVTVARALGAEVIIIDRTDFNHGATRELARKHLNTDIVVMVTPDAYATDNDVLEVLIQPIVDKRAAVAYARQIPHYNAGFFEAFPRSFNYPATSHIRSIEESAIYGVYTFFCSNSFAAYSNAALDDIGGFQTVLLGEDTVAVAQLLRKDYKVAYVAEAEVKHSHRYSLMQEFRRYFDTGLARTEYRHLLDCGVHDGRRGAQFFRSMLRHLIKNKPHLLPYAFVQSGFKWAGYRLGASCSKGPIWLKKHLSSFPGYWTSSHFKPNSNDEI